MAALRNFAALVADLGTPAEWLGELIAAAGLVAFFAAMIVGLPAVYAALGIAA